MEFITPIPCRSKDLISSLTGNVGGWQLLAESLSQSCPWLKNACSSEVTSRPLEAGCVQNWSVRRCKAQLPCLKVGQLCVWELFQIQSYQWYIMSSLSWLHCIPTTSSTQSNFTVPLALEGPLHKLPVCDSPPRKPDLRQIDTSNIWETLKNISVLKCWELVSLMFMISKEVYYFPKFNWSHFNSLWI